MQLLPLLNPGLLFRQKPLNRPNPSIQTHQTHNWLIYKLVCLILFDCSQIVPWTEWSSRKIIYFLKNLVVEYYSLVNFPCAVPKSDELCNGLHAANTCNFLSVVSLLPIFKHFIYNHVQYIDLSSSCFPVIYCNKGFYATATSLPVWPQLLPPATSYRLKRVP